MSISSVGQASGAGNLSQLLASMLSRIKSSAADTAAPSTTTASNTTTTGSSNALTGTDTSNLSDQVIGMLVMMQAQDDSQSDDQSSDAAGTSTSSSDPVSQAFSSLDADGDGTISQSELESAIARRRRHGGRSRYCLCRTGRHQPERHFAKPAFTSAAQAGGPPPGSPPPGGPGGPGGAHGHHHHHGSSGSSDSASQIFAALDTNQDGTVSADELSAALGGSTTATDGSTSSSSDIFSAIDTNGDGSISQDELSSYLDNLQSQSNSDQATLSAFQQLANQSYSAGLSLMASTTITDSITA